MNIRAAIRATVVAGALGSVLGLAPMAAHAWGTDAATYSSCWRTWGSSTTTYGGDGRNRTYLYTSEQGNVYNNFFIRIDAYLKHNGANADFVRHDDYGTSRARDSHGSTSGDRSWTVDAYGQESPGKTSTQKHDSCVVT